MIETLPRTRPFVVAHRFANNLESLSQAEHSGVDLIEADVWFYRDRLEIRHSKTLGPLPVLWDFWSLESGWGPRLELSELLETKRTGTRLLLDLKGRSVNISRALIETIQQREFGAPILVCSQNWKALDEFAQFPGVTRIYSVGNRRQLRRFWDRLLSGSNYNISIDLRILSPPTIMALQEHVATIITWPVNTRDQLDFVLTWGLDGFTSDNLELMRWFVQHR